MDKQSTTNATTAPKHPLPNGAGDEHLTAIDALAKIGKVLDKCDDETRKRVLAFLVGEAK